MFPEATALAQIARRDWPDVRLTDTGWRSTSSALRRLAVITFIAGLFLIPAAAIAAALLLINQRAEARRFFNRRFVALIQRLGPAFIKGGQILGTRRDILPRSLCDELSVLQDSVTELTRAQGQSALRAVYGESLEEIFQDINLKPVATGSIACVYFGRLRNSRQVAIKLQRPGIRRIILADVAVMTMIAAILARLPPLRHVPINELVEHMCQAIHDQLDFVREAESLGRLRRNLSGVNRIWVPRVETEVSRNECVVMEFIPGLELTTSQRCSNVVRRKLAANTLAAVYHMLFVDGFVHCDLHGGNLYFTERGHVIILDAGFSVQLSDRMRRLFGEFFLEMALGRGRRCGEIVIESATSVNPDARTEQFISDMAGLVERNSRLAAKDFSLIAFAAEMFDLQRKFGINAAPELLFPLLSLLVIEGTIRDLDPEIDFQQEAKPILTRGVFDQARTSLC